MASHPTQVEWYGPIPDMEVIHLVKAKTYEQIPPTLWHKVVALCPLSYLQPKSIELGTRFELHGSEYVGIWTLTLHWVHIHIHFTIALCSTQHSNKKSKHALYCTS